MLRWPFFLLLLLSGSDSFSASNGSFNQQNFNTYAQQYGNKTANLRELQKVVGNINQDGNIKTTFAVPPFFGVSHQEVVGYFKSTKADDAKTVYDLIEVKWKEFVKHQQSADKTTIVPGAQKALGEIRAGIHKAFAGMPFKISGNRQDELVNFLGTTLKNNNLLMVRSTGREDSKTLSNAGGNESVSSVSPNVNAISKAMGEVVASYFGEKSIGQRLSFKDPGIYDKPFMPVLLQVMIGEPAGGVKVEMSSSSSSSSSSSTSMQQFKISNVSSIPASGVAFFPEAEARTPGVATIQATWGHNEAVVNGLVPVDSFYVGSSDVVHPLIRIKKNRLITNAQGTGLELTQNPIQLHKKPSLPKQQVLDIRHAIELIKNYYGYPVDIEFVYLNNTIYLVQVRPLEEQKINPTYVDPKMLANIKSDQKGLGTAIGVGGADVRIIENKSQVIIKDTINMALTEFLKRNDKDKIKVVIVGQMAPSTSHEATIFRAHNKPVLKTNIAIVNAWAKNGKFPLVVDPQQEIVFTAIGLGNVAQHILKGWYDHPIPKKVSVLPQYIKKFNANIAKILVPEELFRGKSTTQVLNIIRLGNKDEVVKALKTLLARVAQAITRQSFKQAALKKEGKETEGRLIAQLKQVYMHLATAAGELYQIMQRKHDRLERLYPFVFIHALIQQISDPTEIVNNVSFVSILKTELIEQKLMQQLKGANQFERARIVQYAKADEYALSKTVHNNWLFYLTGFDKGTTQEQKKQFSQMMYTLAQVDVLPTWLNVSFAQSYKQNKGEVENITSDLLKEYASSLSFIEQMKKIGESANSIDMQAWQKPEAFAKQMKLLKENILNYMMNKEFIKQLESTSILGKNVAVATMNKVVEVFDSSIKAMKSSQLYPSIGIQVSNFKSMLKEYFELLDAWSRIPSIQKELEELVSDFKTLANYIKEINSILFNGIKDRSKKQLEPSKGFNVAGAALGSHANWFRSIGKDVRLEDVFTLIHQNLLVITAVLSKQAAHNIDFSVLVEYLKKKLLAISRTSLIGIELLNKALTLYFNSPLRNHSSTFQIMYSYTTQQTEFMVQFIGNARDRWDQMSEMIEMISGVVDWTMSKAPIVDIAVGKLEWGWYIKDQTQIDLMLELLADLMFLTNQERVTNSMRDNILKKIATKAIATDEHIMKIVERAKASEPRDKKNILMSLLHVGKLNPQIASVIIQNLSSLITNDDLMAYLRALNGASQSAKVAQEYERILQWINKDRANLFDRISDGYIVLPAITNLIRETKNPNYVNIFAELIEPIVYGLYYNVSDFEKLYFTILENVPSYEVQKRMFQWFIDQSLGKHFDDQFFNRLFTFVSPNALHALAQSLYEIYQNTHSSKSLKEKAREALYRFYWSFFGKGIKEVNHKKELLSFAKWFVLIVKKIKARNDDYEGINLFKLSPSSSSSSSIK